MLHRSAQRNMVRVWNTKFSHVQGMKNLASIKLDVERLFCYVGCCRTMVLRNLLHTFEEKFCSGGYDPVGPQHLRIPGLKVTIEGIKGDVEEEVVRDTEWPIQMVEQS